MPDRAKPSGPGAAPDAAVRRRSILFGAGVAPAAVVLSGDLAPHQGPGPLAARDPDRGTFVPGEYGAVGDGRADDTAALQATIDAAHEAGGGVLLVAGSFRITGEVVFKDGVGARGVAGTQESSAARIVCGSAEARVLFGSWEEGHDHPGAFRDFVIDGNGTGHPDGLARFQCVQSHFESLVVLDGAGDGMRVDSAQNNTWVSCVSLGHRGAALVLDNGCGGNAWVRGSYSSSAVSLRVTDDARVDNTNVYPWPGHNAWYHCIFESYLPQGETLIALEAGAGHTNRFVGCGISANNEIQLAEDAVVTVTSADAATGTSATFDGCLFSGGASGYPIFKAGAGSGVVISGSTYFGSSRAVFSGSAEATWTVDASHHVYVDCDAVFAEGTGAQGGGAVRVTPAGVLVAEPLSVGGLTRTTASQVVSGTVTVDAAASSVHKLVVTGSDARLEITGGAEGRVLTVWWARTGDQQVTWPSDVRFAGGRPPPPPGRDSWLCLSLIFESQQGRWIEQSRSEVPSG